MLRFKPFPSAASEPGPSLPLSIAIAGEGRSYETTVKEEAVVVKML